MMNCVGADEAGPFAVADGEGDTGQQRLGGEGETEVGEGDRGHAELRSAGADGWFGASYASTSEDYQVSDGDLAGWAVSAALLHLLLRPFFSYSEGEKGVAGERAQQRGKGVADGPASVRFWRSGRIVRAEASGVFGHFRVIPQFS